MKVARYLNFVNNIVSRLLVGEFPVCFQDKDQLVDWPFKIMCTTDPSSLFVKAGRGYSKFDLPDEAIFTWENILNSR